MAVKRQTLVSARLQTDRGVLTYTRRCGLEALSLQGGGGVSIIATLRGGGFSDWLASPGQLLVHGAFTAARAAGGGLIIAADGDEPLVLHVAPGALEAFAAEIAERP